MSHTVVVVEDDAPTRRRIVSAVAAREGLEVVGEAGSLSEGRVLLVRETPDVVLIDLGLPDGSGIELIDAARSIGGDTQSMVITVFGDEKSVLDAVEAGARGYLLKDAPPEQIGEAVLQLVAGGSPISPSIARTLLQRFQSPATTDPQTTPSLSDREREVLGLVVKGLTYQEIAEVLGIAATTVTTHVRRIYRKLEVRSRGEAVYEALSQGIVQVED